MIQTQGFATSQNIGSLADEINRWLVSNTKELDTKFRLIDIKYAASAEPIPESRPRGETNYSALIVYEIGETKRIELASEPLETSGVE